jgi:hypothetical protein
MSGKSMVFKNKIAGFYDLFANYGGIAAFATILHPGDEEVMM